MNRKEVEQFNDGMTMNMKQLNTLAVASNADVRFYNNGFVAAIETHSLDGAVFFRCRVKVPIEADFNYNSVSAWLEGYNGFRQCELFTFECTLTHTLNDTWSVVNRFIEFFE